MKNKRVGEIGNLIWDKFYFFGDIINLIRCDEALFKNE